MITRRSGDDVHFWNTIQETIPGGKFGSGSEEHGLTLEDWERIGEVKTFPKNHKLISADEVPKCLYIVELAKSNGNKSIVK